MQRIRSNMGLYGLWDKRFEAHIVPVLGEMSLPIMGMDEETWAAMCSEVCVFVCCVCVVSWLQVVMSEEWQNELAACLETPEAMFKPKHNLRCRTDRHHHPQRLAIPCPVPVRAAQGL